MLFFFFSPPPRLRPACCSETGVNTFVFYYLVVTCFPGCVSMLSEATQAQVVSLGCASELGSELCCSAMYSALYLSPSLFI